jgi:hypothetical protein
MAASFRNSLFAMNQSIHEAWTRFCRIQAPEHFDADTPGKQLKTAFMGAENKQSRMFGQPK